VGRPDGEEARSTTMTDERQLQEATARCVGVMVFYQHSERTRDSLARMGSEIRQVAERIAGMGLTEDKIEREVVRTVEFELMARYGHELGPRIVADFLDAYPRGWAPDPNEAPGSSSRPPLRVTGRSPIIVPGAGRGAAPR
jgi:hypothetical protein